MEKNKFIECLEEFENLTARYLNEDYLYTEILKLDKEESQRPWLKYYPKEVVDAKLPENTIYGYIKSRNNKELDRTAIEYFGNKLTYKELIKKIDNCAKSLVAMGVKEGDIIKILDYEFEYTK